VYKAAATLHTKTCLDVKQQGQMQCAMLGQCAAVVSLKAARFKWVALCYISAFIVRPYSERRHKMLELVKSRYNGVKKRLKNSSCSSGMYNVDWNPTLRWASNVHEVKGDASTSPITEHLQLEYLVKRASAPTVTKVLCTSLSAGESTQWDS
jgi:hypothetical protein